MKNKLACTSVGAIENFSLKNQLNSTWNFEGSVGILTSVWNQVAFLGRQDTWC